MVFRGSTELISLPLQGTRGSGPWGSPWPARDRPAARYSGRRATRCGGRRAPACRLVASDASPRRARRRRQGDAPTGIWKTGILESCGSARQVSSSPERQGVGCAWLDRKINWQIGKARRGCPREPSLSATALPLALLPAALPIRSLPPDHHLHLLIPTHASRQATRCWPHPAESCW